jgi:hypothetical protein
LDALAGELHEARAGIASLNAELLAAEEVKAKLEAEVDMWRAKDAEYQRLRDQCHWLGVFAERKVRCSGQWEDELKVGFAFLSLFGRRKYGLIGHALPGPDFHLAAGGGSMIKRSLGYIAAGWTALRRVCTRLSICSCKSQVIVSMALLDWRP